jgi:hypothetical protein
LRRRAARSASFSESPRHDARSPHRRRLNAALTTQKNVFFPLLGVTQLKSKLLIFMDTQLCNAQTDSNKIRYLTIQLRNSYHQLVFINQFFVFVETPSSFAASAIEMVTSA